MPGFQYHRGTGGARFPGGGDYEGMVSVGSHVDCAKEMVTVAWGRANLHGQANGLGTDVYSFLLLEFSD